MKTALAIIGQLALFIVFVLVFLGGGVLGTFHLDPFGLQWFLSHPTPVTIRYFVPTGLILMILLFAIVLGIEAAAKRIRTAGLWTSAAFVLALVIGLVARFGWVQTS